MVHYKRENELVIMDLNIFNTALYSVYFTITESLCMDETDAPMAKYIFKSVQTFKRLDSKAFWTAHCVSGVVFYP